MTELLIVGALLIVLSLGGIPLFAIVSALGLLAFTLAGIDPAALIVELYRLADFPSLIAIPLFTFAGYTLAESQAPRRLINFAQAIFGAIPGGLAVVTLLVAAVFTALTGATGVTIIALGGILYPSLIKHGYPEKFALGLMTTAGSLGLLFPPSLPIILYSFVANVPVDRLFLAGLVPGVLLVIILATYCIKTGFTSHVERTSFEWRQIWKTFKEAAWELPLPIFVVGGIYAGWFTTTEAAAVAAFYALVVEVFIRRDLKLFKDMPRITRATMILVGAIIMMLGAAVGLTNYLIDQEVPQMIFQTINKVVSNKYEFLLILNAILLGVNMMETFSAIIIFVPIIAPIAANYGIDPVHLGIMFLLNLEIGYMIPPLALNIFIASIRFEAPLPKIYRAVVPFLVLLLSTLMLITYVPDLSLGLLKMLNR
jgi:tripartite ATP-independent transporter DctM subunit